MELTGSVIGMRYSVMPRLLGNGSFGTIVLGKDTVDDVEVAIKLEPVQARTPQLLHEAKVLKSLNGVEGFPKVHWVGVDDSKKYNVMVLDLLGPTLEDLFDFCTRKLTPKSVCLIADQLILRLKEIHTRGFIHRDIKPENFLVGLQNNSSLVFVVDFGLTKPYRSFRTGQHVQQKEGAAKKDLVGTARYASSNAHLGLELSRRDDLESLGYVLVYLAKGILPWQGIKGATAKEKYEKIGVIKRNVPLNELCTGAPPPLLPFLEYTRQLGFEDEPDYGMLQGLFSQYSTSQKFHYDGIFDWTVLSTRGKLTVIVSGARNLAGKNSNGLSNPFCTLSLGKHQRKRTTVINQDLNPEWDCTLEFMVTDPSSELSVSVWSNRMVLRNKFLGCISVPVSSLRHKEWCDEWYTLQKRSPKSRVNGDIRLRVLYTQALSSAADP